jgi:hypothetical protein
MLRQEFFTKEIRRLLRCGPLLNAPSKDKATGLQNNDGCDAAFPSWLLGPAWDSSLGLASVTVFVLKSIRVNNVPFT